MVIALEESDLKQFQKRATSSKSTLLSALIPFRAGTRHLVVVSFDPQVGPGAVIIGSISVCSPDSLLKTVFGVGVAFQRGIGVSCVCPHRRVRPRRSQQPPELAKRIIGFVLVKETKTQ